MTSNPYAAPQAYDSSSPIDNNLWMVHEGELIVRDGAILPDICIITGQSPAKRIKKPQLITYYPPLLLLLILFALIIFLIIAAIVQKKAKITYSITPAIKKKYQLRAAFSLFLMIASLLGGIYALSQNFAIVGLAGFISFTVFLVATVICSNLGKLSAKKHREGWFYLKGYKKPYLDALVALQNQRNAAPTL